MTISVYILKVRKISFQEHLTVIDSNHLIYLIISFMNE